MTEIETVLSAYTQKFNQKLETYFPVSIEAPGTEGRCCDAL